MNKDMVFLEAVKKEEELTDAPQSPSEMRARPDWPKWQEAVQAEMNSMLVNGIYILIDLPRGVTAIPVIIRHQCTHAWHVWLWGVGGGGVTMHDREADSFVYVVRYWELAQ